MVAVADVEVVQQLDDVVPGEAEPGGEQLSLNNASDKREIRLTTMYDSGIHSIWHEIGLCDMMFEQQIPC